MFGKVAALSLERDPFGQNSRSACRFRLSHKRHMIVNKSGAVCERAEWKKLVKPGDFYVGDRYYGEDYDLLRLMSLKNCGYVVRMRQNT
ncbi:MAG: hypothetical protein ACI8V5_004921 [Limisphaerales bacterium]